MASAMMTDLTTVLQNAALSWETHLEKARAELAQAEREVAAGRLSSSGADDARSWVAFLQRRIVSARDGFLLVPKAEHLGTHRLDELKLQQQYHEVINLAYAANRVRYDETPAPARNVMAETDPLTLGPTSDATAAARLALTPKYGDPDESLVSQGAAVLAAVSRGGNPMVPSELMRHPEFMSEYGQWRIRYQEAAQKRQSEASTRGGSTPPAVLGR